jgi:hypothetical protein
MKSTSSTASDDENSNGFEYIYFTIHIIFSDIFRIIFQLISIYLWFNSFRKTRFKKLVFTKNNNFKKFSLRSKALMKG